MFKKLLYGCQEEQLVALFGGRENHYYSPEQL